MGGALLTVVSAGLLFFCASAQAATYYIAGNGGDSNNGTSKSTPWLHAPGMTGCTGNCASKAPQPGDQFILRGGDTWHEVAGSPIGLSWSWTWSGTSGNRIYVGVDQTWFSGSSWARPVLTRDNPTSTSFVTSCSHDDASLGEAVWISASYVTFDNFEFTGQCSSGVPGYGDAVYLGENGNTGITMSHLYFHGWTNVMHTGKYYDAQRCIQGSTSNSAGLGNVISDVVIDGSDTNSIHGTNDGSVPGSMFAIYGEGYDIHNSTIRYVSNAVVCNNCFTFHDNLVEHVVNSYDGATHTNVYEQNAPTSSSANQFFYNNVVRYNWAGVGFWPVITSGGVLYAYNNIVYGWGGSGNCWMISGANSTLQFWNNTVDNCHVRFTGNGNTPPFTGPANFENNHFIGYGGQNLSSVYNADNGASPTVHDNGGQIYQSEPTANSQGYTQADDYAPATGSGSTVNAGNSLVSFCASAGAALCSDTSAGHTRTPTLRPSSGAWDVGAYEFVGTGPSPSPPTGLTATAH
jgi:hypothetical protein